MSWFHGASHLSQVPWREVEGHYSPTHRNTLQHTASHCSNQSTNPLPLARAVARALYLSQTHKHSKHTGNLSLGLVSLHMAHGHTCMHFHMSQMTHPFTPQKIKIPPTYWLAKAHSMPYLYTSFSAKEIYSSCYWLLREKSPATSGILWVLRLVQRCNSIKVAPPFVIE